jgi:23S rRNA (adenine1618-N6)-methyltransferase
MNNTKAPLKPGLHPRNKHKSNYDFKTLIEAHPALQKFVRLNDYKTESIDFSNADAVKALNTALLKYFYEINFWDIPKDYLCPPIPGRADYIHHLADLYQNPNSSEIRMLDIGVGANCIYPLIANKEYNWQVVGSDTDEVALESAEKIIEENNLQNQIELRHQNDQSKIFENIIDPEDFFDFTVCNPPFHASLEEAMRGTNLKNRNLGLKRNNQNFKGQSSELWCEGGEVKFITNMIHESIKFQKNVKWFSTLVSKSSTLDIVYAELKKANIVKVRNLDMAQGNKKSRIIAWTFR